MKEENLCFVDCGAEHITLALCKIEHTRLKEVLFYSRARITIQPQRQNNVFEIPEIYDKMLELINEAEKKSKTTINEIIFISAIKAINLTFVRKSFTFKKRQKITQMGIERMLAGIVKDFYTKMEEKQSMLDFIPNNYTIDNTKLVNNPYKLSCEKIVVNAEIISIDKTFEMNFSSYLERYKIHVKHYISPCVAISHFIKQRLDKNSAHLLVDIGAYTTEYCIIKGDNVLFLDNLNLGGFDLTRDIANVMHTYIKDADKLKQKITPELLNAESKTTQYVAKQVESIADARLLEIAKSIAGTIREKQGIKNLKIVKVIILGGTSKYLNTEKIFAEEFQCVIEKIDENIYQDIDNGQEILTKIGAENLKEENIQMISSIIFYLSNLDAYQRAKRGFLFKMPSKISCILRDLLY